MKFIGWLVGFYGMLTLVELFLAEVSLTISLFIHTRYNNETFTNILNS